jgi:hypothetical protein
MPTITITIAGPTATGRTFLKHQIGAMLSSRFGLDIKVDEKEVNIKGVMQRLYEPHSFVQAMKAKGVKIVLEEKQLNRMVNPSDLAKARTGGRLGKSG